jgi:hypothetical protein
VSSASDNTLGAPECFTSSNDESQTSRSTPSITQDVDIWSLGCIYSEAAMWVADGHKGILDYRRQRISEASQVARFNVAQRDVDCFHDGERTLTSVLVAHRDVDQRLRRADHITKDVLDAMVTEMLWDEDRPSAKALWRKAELVLGRAHQKLASSTGNSRAMAYPSPPLPNQSSPHPSLERSGSDRSRPPVPPLPDLNIPHILLRSATSQLAEERQFPANVERWRSQVRTRVNSDVSPVANAPTRQSRSDRIENPSVYSIAESDFERETTGSIASWQDSNSAITTPNTPMTSPHTSTSQYGFNGFFECARSQLPSYANSAVGGNGEELRPRPLQKNPSRPSSSLRRRPTNETERSRQSCAGNTPSIAELSDDGYIVAPSDARDQQADFPRDDLVLAASAPIPVNEEVDRTIEAEDAVSNTSHTGPSQYPSSNAEDARSIPSQYPPSNAENARPTSRPVLSQYPSSNAENARPASRSVPSQYPSSNAEDARPISRPAPNQYTPLNAEDARSISRLMPSQYPSSNAEDARPASRSVPSRYPSSNAENARPASRPAPNQYTPLNAEDARPTSRPVPSQYPSSNASVSMALADPTPTNNSSPMSYPFTADNSYRPVPIPPRSEKRIHGTPLSLFPSRSTSVNSTNLNPPPLQPLPPPPITSRATANLVPVTNPTPLPRPAIPAAKAASLESFPGTLESFPGTLAVSPTPLPPHSSRSTSITASISTTTVSALSFIEHLTIQGALDWKRAHKTSSKKAPSLLLPGATLLERHLQSRERDHIFIVDDGVSMMTRGLWPEVQRVFEALAYLLKPHARDGIELFFAVAYDTWRRKNTSELCDLLAKKKPAPLPPGQPQGTDISYRLKLQLQAYGAKISAEAASAAAGSPAPKKKSRTRKSAASAASAAAAAAGISTRPLSLYILTDGAWKSGSDPVPHIKALASQLAKAGLRDARQISIQFISFGDNAAALQRIQTVASIDYGL